MGLKKETKPKITKASLNKAIKQKITALETEIDTLKKVVKFTKTIDPTKIKDLKQYTILPNGSYKEEATAISQFGDFHIDEIVVPNRISKLNEYNPKIAQIRAERYFRRLVYVINKHRKGGITIPHLVLHLAGDMVSGWIHEELIQTNTITPVQAALLVEKVLIKGITYLSKNAEMESITVICSVGNHARTSTKLHFKNPVQTSYEYIIYNNVAMHCELLGLKNVEFIIPEGVFWYHKIYDKINLFSHGNHFGYQGGIGGIEVPMKRWLYKEGAIEAFDMAWIGHWHSYLAGTKIRVNGSVIGYNEYARGHGLPPEPPMMQFQLLDKLRGFTVNEPIILTDF